MGTYAMGYRQLLNVDPECWLLACSCFLAQGSGRGSDPWKLNGLFDCPAPVESMVKRSLLLSSFRYNETRVLRYQSTFKPRHTILARRSICRGTYLPTRSRNPNKIYYPFSNDNMNNKDRKICIHSVSLLPISALSNAQERLEYYTCEAWFRWIFRGNSVMVIGSLILLLA